MTQKEKRRNAILVITMFLVTAYLCWRIIFTLPIHEGILNIIFGILLVTAETVTVFTTFELFMQKMKSDNFRLECPTIPPEYFPDIDVFIATHNESEDLLYKTVNACTFMEYPDKSKVHIYLCDDGNREEIAQLAKKFNVGYLGLANNINAKSGNLNNALSKTKSPLIATFDADMIPQHTFLMKTVPYFLLEKFIKENDVWRLREETEIDTGFKIGLIQTPQSFYNADLFQFNLYAEQSVPNEQDFFSREINVMRNASNAISYTGSNTVIARKAMEEIGGFPLDTITEDFETSIRIQQEGYITYATQEVQAAGLTTTTISSMLKQRVRWARGIIHSVQNTNAVFSKKLPLKSRITYLNSFLYWWSFFFRLIFIVSPILFALFDFRIVNSGFWNVVVFWLPAYLFYGISMRFLSSNIRNQRWSQVIDTILMPYLIIPVLLETLRIHENKFVVTNKKKETDDSVFKVISLLIPVAILLALSISAIIRFVYGKYGWALFYGSIIIFWLIYNMVALLYALFFMLGRHALRQTERISAEESISIQYENLFYQAKTIDISETGVSIFCQQPIYLPELLPIQLMFKTSHYTAQLTGKIVYVKKYGDGWKYTATVIPVDEENKRQYMQIIYDRLHSLPKEMNLWDTAYDDILRNIKRRITRTIRDQRKTLRIALNQPVTFTNGASCTLRSFNYHYFSASDFRPSRKFNDTFTFFTVNGIKIVLKRTGKKIANTSQELLEVANLDDLVAHGLVNRIISDLTAPEKI